MNAMDESPECSDSSDCEKENENTNHSTKRVRISKDQMKHMKRFIKDHSEPLDASMWDKLTAELNTIGPVVQPSTKWRRSWSVHKYNVKKQVEKLMADVESTTSQDVPSNSSPRDRTDETSIWHKVLELLEIINQKLDDMDRKIDKITEHFKEIDK